ncbi:MAG: HEAT repeat domain-containing protein [Planctomycetes bacterium]|nr:HEAT repeat domain-containing protein [Planctomycetota bacterium]
MTRVAAPLLLCLALAPLARGQVDGSTWTDPTLEEAVRDADLIVLAECAAVGRAGGASYKVTKTFKGPARDGREVAVVGLDLPGAAPGERVVAVGDRAYLLLRGTPTGAVLSVPTPTFGRFPVQASGQVVASFSDTFVRVGLAAARWERLLAALVAGAADEALLAEARAALRQKEPDATEAYVALEVLALFGQEADGAAVEAVLDHAAFAEPHRFRVRIAAAQALGRLGGASGVERLLGLVERDPLEVVQSAAAEALWPALERLFEEDDRGARRACERLAALTIDGRATPIRFGSANDPRENERRGPLAAALRTLGALRARAGIPPALRALERVDDPAALVAGLLFFQELGDPEQAGAIAYRMREPDAKDHYFNPLFSRALEKLTGQRLGDERAPWVRWSRERALLPQGPDAPLGPTPGERPGGARR